MTDHYELLGVEPGAGKDEIRAAYRAAIADADSSTRAELNRAWNVLSDPIQRQRYDDALASGDETAAAEVVPARSGARRGSESSAPEVVDTKSDAARPARMAPEPTFELPPGMHRAEKRQHGYAIAFDFSVLAALYIVMAFVVMPAVLENRYPNRVERIDAISKCLKALDVDEPKPAKLRSDCEREGVQLGDVSTNKKKDAEVERLKDEATDVQRPMLGTTYLLLAGLFVLCLLYVVPSTVATGQTLGKKLRQVWLVRVDGSKVRLGGAIAHYAVPVAVAIAIPQIGVIIALGMVLWSLRDRNGQGVHDKLARTVVVDVPPDGAKEDR